MTIIRPLVSVIIPYHSHGRHLHQAVHSALRAYSGPKEILIVDDGSVEAKARIYIESAAALASEVRVIVQPNAGLSSARNTGIEAARGDFAQFLDSDDLLMPGKIDLQMDHFQIQPRLDISLSNYVLCDESVTRFMRDGDSISRYSFSLPDFLYSWERGFSIPIHCGLFRRSAFDGIRFDTTVAGKEDWIFWCRQAYAGRRFGYAPVYGAIYRQHDQGMSKSFRAMGDNWLRAAERIRDAIGLNDPRFESEVQAWHRTFYAPRIAEEAAVPSVAPVSHAATLRTQHAGDTSWIGGLTFPAVSNSRTPRFSIVVPIYNHHDYLQSCLTSVAKQEAPGGIEVILADDGSSDPRIRPLLEAFARAAPNVRLLPSDRNQGISAIQNTAVEAARGEFVAFVDCDDALEPGAMSAVAQAIQPGVDYLFSDRTDVDEQDRPLRVATYGGYNWLVPSGDIPRDLLDGMVASHLKVIRRDIYRRAGGSDPAYSGVQDWELALKIADAGGKFVHIPKALYRHRIHANSVTSSESVRQFWLSNIARRRFAAKWLSRRITDHDARQRAERACAELAHSRQPDAADVLVVREFRIPYTLEVLKKAWRAGQVCVYAPKADAIIAEMNTVREYNSYLDGVLAADETVASFLIGYMWDHNALHYAGEATMLFRTS